MTDDVEVRDSNGKLLATAETEAHFEVDNPSTTDIQLWRLPESVWPKDDGAPPEKSIVIRGAGRSRRGVTFTGTVGSSQRSLPPDRPATLAWPSSTGRSPLAFGSPRPAN